MKYIDISKLKKDEFTEDVIKYCMERCVNNLSSHTFDEMLEDAAYGGTLKEKEYNELDDKVRCNIVSKLMKTHEFVLVPKED